MDIEKCKKDYVIMPYQTTTIEFKSNKFGILHVWFEPTDLNDTLVRKSNDKINIEL